jgi:hypothetical protein
MALSLPPGIFDIYNEAVDNIWSRKITIVYPKRKTECPNCENNGFKSTGIYKTGGPYPFEDGFPCLYCDGLGFKFIETTEDIKGRVYYSRKDWVDIGVPINLANAVAQTVIDIKHLPKLQQCQYIIPEYYEGIDTNRVKPLQKASDYYPQGFLQNPVKYIVTFWTSYAD